MTQESSNTAQSVIQDIVSKVSINAATPEWWAVLSCRTDQGYMQLCKAFGYQHPILRLQIASAV